ncbi:MAG TPA: hypothetical protein VKC59_08930, partial [Candidatus Limnocylindrales bacterium]|nr:hypothetical protein [Candidatus Limnocylindrales bacterium]
PWSNGPAERYAAHEHGYDKVIVVERGSIVFGLPADRRSISLDAGDRLELPAGTQHDAIVGPSGVTCLEAHLPAGVITERVRTPLAYPTRPRNRGLVRFPGAISQRP